MGQSKRERGRYSMRGFLERAGSAEWLGTEVGGRGGGGWGVGGQVSGLKSQACPASAIL